VAGRGLVPAFNTDFFLRYSGQAAPVPVPMLLMADFPQASQGKRRSPGTNPLLGNRKNRSFHPENVIRKIWHAIRILSEELRVPYTEYFNFG